jgi:hypothetical protein
VSVSFQFHNQERGRGTWKFNNSLLYDPDYVTLVKNCIHEVILQYSVPTLDEDLAFSINDQLLWEIIKMTIRGKTIAFASHKKREREKREKELEKNLENLYVSFNENPTEIIRQNIDVNETELKNLREEKIKGLIIHAKAKWQVEGEKSTNYFCNLEKRHFTEKLIPKLIVENNEITDLSQIIKEQANFYKSLYSTNKNTSHRHEMFFDKTNPFFNFLTEDDKQKCEGAFSKEECLKALKKYEEQ